MNFLSNVVLATANLPSITTGGNWFTGIIEQIVVLFVIYLIVKNFAKFKIGAIISCMVIGGVVYFAVRNWNTVYGWIEALINTL